MSFLIAILIILAAVIVFAVLFNILTTLSNHVPSVQKSKRKLKMYDGDVVAIGDVDRDVPQQFKGKGTWSSKPTQLEPGEYRLRYDFSFGAVRVGLVSSFDGENETLLIKSGSGVEGFGVMAGGRYIFEVQPADESAEWKIEYQHLTRYGAIQEEDDHEDMENYIS